MTDPPTPRRSRNRYAREVTEPLDSARSNRPKHRRRSSAQPRTLWSGREAKTTAPDDEERPPRKK